MIAASQSPNSRLTAASNTDRVAAGRGPLVSRRSFLAAAAGLGAVGIAGLTPPRAWSLPLEQVAAPPIFEHTGPDKGWPDIAYNFMVDRFGQIFEARAGSLAGPVAGSATGGNQGFSQLCCFLGHGLSWQVLNRLRMAELDPDDPWRDEAIELGSGTEMGDRLTVAVRT